MTTLSAGEAGAAAERAAPNAEEAAARKEMRSVRTKLVYGVGSVAFGVKDQGFAYFLLFFYNQVIGLSAIAVGTAIAIALAADAFVDPLIGQISDNLRTGWGRRHPLMYGAALPLGLAYWFLWNPPHWAQGSQFYYLIAAAILIRTLISVYEVPSSAMLAELTHDYDERTAMFGYRYFFGWMGGLAMTLLGFGVFFKASPRFPQGQLDPSNYKAYALCASLTMIVAIFVSAAGTQRFVPYFSKPPQRRPTIGTILREVGASVKNRSFVVLGIAAFFGACAVGVANAANFYFATFFWELTAHQIFLLTLSTIPGPIVAMFLAPYLGRRFSKRRAALWLYVVSLTVNWGPLALRLIGFFPENRSPLLVPTLLWTGLLGNILAVTTSIMLSSMLADVVEDSQIKTGRRSEGLFFSVNAFVAKAVSGMGGLIASFFLALAHFPANAKPGPAAYAGVTHFAWIYFPAVLGMYIVAVTTIFFYDITRESHEEALRGLSLR